MWYMYYLLKATLEKNLRCKKYVYIRDKSIKTGQELFCGRRTRNKNLNEENLHKYRGAKKSNGRRNIRKQRYAYQPKDIVIFESKKYSVQGVQNKGEYIKLMEMSKPVKTDLVKPYMFRKGFSMFYNYNSSPTYRMESSSPPRWESSCRKMIKL